MAGPYFIGVDVGTGSARAGVFDATGQRLGVGSEPIQIWRPAADFVEQSSEDIWQACCRAVAQAMREAKIAAGDVAGVGFDATCSLVVVGKDGSPISVSPSESPAQNVIVWMDHRATAEAEQINRTEHPVLQYVGGTISPEMQTPKLLWLKRHRPRTFERAGHFFDLADYLVWRATGCEVRSLCTTVCKWTYLGHEDPGEDAPDLCPGNVQGLGRWDHTYFDQIDLGELADEGYARIGRCVRPMGEPVGRGLVEPAAGQMGLPPGTAVSVGIIDAHAGGLGLLGAAIDGRLPDDESLQRRIALIGGTSTCHMAVSAAPRYVPGVWGPYFGAMVPGYWLTEGGQSATGALVDHVIATHAASAGLAEQADRDGRTVYELLNDRLATLAGEGERGRLTARRHVLPYFHGNRSPRANPHLRGAVTGLRLDGSADDLAVSYLAAIQAIAYGTRHIIAALNAAGYQIETILACGGGTKNPVFVQEHADVTGLPVVLPREPEAVLLGSAMLGAVAAGRFATVPEAMGAMSTAGRVVQPNLSLRDYHQAKFEVFLRMHDDWQAYERLMARAK